VLLFLSPKVPGWLRMTILPPQLVACCGLPVKQQRTSSVAAQFYDRPACCEYLICKASYQFYDRPVLRQTIQIYLSVTPRASLAKPSRAVLRQTSFTTGHIIQYIRILICRLLYLQIREFYDRLVYSCLHL
jgi:hypothetical protein